MMHLHTAGRADALADALAGVLAGSPADPMIPEWVAAPSLGVHRWLALELSRRLGDGGVGDGVAAHLTRAFPDSLRDRVLDAGRGDGPELWEVERLAWTVLGILARPEPDPQLAVLGGPGPSHYARARRVADLFDRYHRHRPEMIRAWQAGRDVDGLGRRLASEHRWQPHLWRRVRGAIGLPSPPERSAALLSQLAAGTLALDLPERLSFFGLAVLPGGDAFLELAAAVGRVHDVHLYLLQPCRYEAAALRRRAAGDRHLGMWPRVVDDEPLERHPLLASWGSLLGETAVLLAAAELPAPTEAPEAPAGAPDTVLAALRADLRANRAPAASHAVHPQDRSVQFHACYGERRQVEVLRDTLLHLLADPDLALCEDDIVVLCPALERFAPMVEAVFGPSSDGPVVPGAAPALRYRIADRSLRAGNAVLNALAQLVDLADGRFEAGAVLDFISLAPVRQRFGLSDADLGAIESWVVGTNVRWGLDGGHRRQHGVPVGDANTWRAGLDRLLLGVATTDGALRTAIGETVVYAVEGDHLDTLGELAELVARLGELARRTVGAHPLDEWVALFSQAARELFGAPADAPWQLDDVESLLGSLLDSAAEAGGPTGTDLSYDDLRAVFGERLAAEAGRPNFFRGGITVTSLASLRWVPFKVVCLLGMDQGAFGAGGVDGDDLLAVHPVLGDRDRRAEVRQQLLEAVLSATHRLVVLREGHSLRTNQVVPPAVVVSELHDAVLATADRASRNSFAARLELEHPRQAYDERCFEPGALVPGTAWSFDPAELANARAKRERTGDVAAFLRTPLRGAEPPDEVVELAELRRFLRHPVEYFVNDRLGLALPRRAEDPSSLLPVHLEPLVRYEVGERVLQHVLEGADLDRCLRIERGLGQLPPGPLGEAAEISLRPQIDAVLLAADAVGVERGAGAPQPVDVLLADGTRVVGEVVCRLRGHGGGPASVRFVRHHPDLVLAPWLDLMALTAAHPGIAWHSVVVTRAADGSAAKVIDLAPAAPDARAGALDALDVIVDCFRRGEREPLPLFPRLAARIATGTSAQQAVAWKDEIAGDRQRAATVLAFGSPSLPEVLAVPLQPGDPDGRGEGRVARYGRYLFDALARTSRELALPETAP